MSDEQKIPGFIRLGSWILSFIVFMIGFWHTHLGLKQMNVFGSEYGSIAVAGIVLILLIISYWYAINGRSIAIYFYIICGFVFFVSNLNYFYPAYEGRNLLNEEALLIRSSINNYADSASMYIEQHSHLRLYNIIESLKRSRITALTEIENNNGMGGVAREHISDFNAKVHEYGLDPAYYAKAGGNFTSNKIRNKEISAALDATMSKTIAFAENRIQGYLKIVNSKNQLNNISADSKARLDSIISDKSDVSLDSIKQNTQIIYLQNLVSSIDSAVLEINSGLETSENKLKKLIQIKELTETDKLQIPKSQFLGQFRHTVEIIGSRLFYTSTLFIILMCLFIDIIVPLGIYILLRDDNTSASLTLANRIKRKQAF
jgi:hypothetical protein